MSDDQWSLEVITASLSNAVPVIAGGLLANTLDADDARRRWAGRALDHVKVLCNNDVDRLEAAKEAFAITSLDFLRLQARFLKTGRYACGSASDLSSLYSDPEQMTEYLDGLALSYAMWQNHAATLDYFVEEYVESLGATPRVLEIGPGHGLFAALLFERRPDASYLAVDISPSSLAYTERALRSASIPEERFDLHHADVTADAFAAAEEFDAVVCCEVLEHVDDPSVVLAAIRRLLAENGRGFITTVANMEAVDHVYLFDDVEHIRRVVGTEGLAVVDDRPSVLAGAEDQDRIPVNYSAIVAR